jgi:hypothetical protein
VRATVATLHEDASVRKHRAIFERLSRLSNAPATPEYNAEYLAQVQQEKNDRGAVLLIGSNLENTLESAIGKFCVHERLSLLFGADKPLGTFRNKILVAYAIDLFGNVTFENLEAIRHIRNAFAHAKIPISFQTPEVIAANEILDIGPLLPAHFKEGNQNKSVALEGLDRFKHACHWIANKLARTYLTGPLGIAPEALKVPLPSEDYFVSARPKGLP